MEYGIIFGVILGSMRIMEKKMETTTMGYHTEILLYYIQSGIFYLLKGDYRPLLSHRSGHAREFKEQILAQRYKPPGEGM